MHRPSARIHQSHDDAGYSRIARRRVSLAIESVGGSPLRSHIARQSEESATRVYLVLWRATRAIEENAARSVSTLGLGHSDFAVLEVLLHRGPQPVNVIGKKVLLTSASITAAVDRLETRKLLRRTSDPKDDRSRIVELTESGRR